MPPVNIRLLARELNLSISTVSKALKDSHEISAETKERVLAMAKKLHYTPNPYASSLRRKKSKTIAVVIPEVADSFFSLAIKGIEEIAQAKGYHVLIYLTYESAMKETKILEEFISGRVDGVLLSVTSETQSQEQFEALHEADVPLVFFDRALDCSFAARVRTNDFESGYLAARHLLQQGCKRITFFSISSELDIDQKRLLGFRTALSEPAPSGYTPAVLQCSNNTLENERLFTGLMQSDQRPDGVIASVEKLVTPFYLVCQREKIRIPEDVKVIGFSNLSTAAILSPPLTTITQPAFEMGKAAASLLFMALEKRHASWPQEDVVLPSVLLPRRSTGAG